MKIFFSKPLFALIALTSIVFTSCSKNDSNPGPGPGPNPSKKIARIEESDNSITTFTYNTDGTFQKIQTTDDSGEGNTMSFTYANNKIASITNSDRSKIVYAYDGSKITKADIFDESNNKVSYNSFTYQNGKVASVSVNMIVDDEGESQSIEYMKTSFTYYGNGDTKDMSVSIFNPLTNQLELTQKRSFEQYDTKTNPLAQLGDFSTAFLMDMSVRNVLLEKSFNGAGELVETVENQYTYDAAGYPVQVTIKTSPAGGTAETSTLKYFYN